MGSGTRLKVLDGLAVGKAIVSTSPGCEGIRVTAGENLLIADDPSTFAQAVLRVLHDPSLRERLGQNGRELVQREYSWSAIVPRLERFYAEILASCPKAVNGYRAPTLGPIAVGSTGQRLARGR